MPIPSEPLYLQIIQQVRALILSGELAPANPLPSIRGVALSHHISVITVQKAYDELVREQLVVARRGKGYFVANLLAAGKIDHARSHCLNGLRKPIADALKEGLEPRRIRRLVDELLAELSQPAGPNRSIG